VLAQTDVGGKTNEITRFRPLLQGLNLDGCIITADALHTQRDHATFLVAEKNAHYVLIVKKNQPSLHTQLKRLLWKQVPVADRQRDRGHGRQERRTLKVLTVQVGATVPPRQPGHRLAGADNIAQAIRHLSRDATRTLAVLGLT
jgi:predicted transposase YbfD/YdcC